MRPLYQHQSSSREPRGDLLLLDIEMRSEQLRQLKTFEPRRLMIQGLTAGGVLMGAGGAIGALFVHLVHG